MQKVIIFIISFIAFQLFTKYFSIDYNLFGMELDWKRLLVDFILFLLFYFIVLMLWSAFCAVGKR